MFGIKIDLEELEDFIIEWERDIFSKTSESLEKIIKQIEWSSSLQELSEYFNGDPFCTRLSAFFFYIIKEDPHDSPTKSFLNIYIKDQNVYIAPTTILVDILTCLDSKHDFSYNMYSNTELSFEEWNKRKEEWRNAINFGANLIHNTINISPISTIGYNKLIQFFPSVIRSETDPLNLAFQRIVQSDLFSTWE